MDKEKIKEFQKEMDQLLKKYNLKLGGVIDFPMYKVLPDEVNLALKVLEKHGVSVNCSVKEASGNQS